MFIFFMSGRYNEWLDQKMREENFVGDTLTAFTQYSEVMFVSDGQYTSDELRAFEKDGFILLGVGGGKFDDHATQNKVRAKSTCGLVWQALNAEVKRNLIRRFGMDAKTANEAVRRFQRLVVDHLELMDSEAMDAPLSLTSMAKEAGYGEIYQRPEGEEVEVFNCPELYTEDTFRRLFWVFGLHFTAVLLLPEFIAPEKMTEDADKLFAWWLLDSRLDWTGKPTPPARDEGVGDEEYIMELEGWYESFNSMRKVISTIEDEEQRRFLDLILVQLRDHFAVMNGEQKTNRGSSRKGKAGERERRIWEEAPWLNPGSRHSPNNLVGMCYSFLRLMETTEEHPFHLSGAVVRSVMSHLMAVYEAGQWSFHVHAPAWLKEGGVQYLYPTAAEWRGKEGKMPPAIAVLVGAFPPAVLKRMRDGRHFNGLRPHLTVAINDGRVNENGNSVPSENGEPVRSIMLQVDGGLLEEEEQDLVLRDTGALLRLLEVSVFGKKLPEEWLPKLRCHSRFPFHQIPGLEEELDLVFLAHTKWNPEREDGDERVFVEFLGGSITHPFVPPPPDVITNRMVVLAAQIAFNLLFLGHGVVAGKDERENAEAQQAVDFMNFGNILAHLNGCKLDKLEHEMERILRLWKKWAIAGPVSRV